MAETWGYLPEGFPNPARGVPKSRTRSRNRYLSEPEASKLLEAVDQDTDPRFPPLIRLYLLTGARKSELMTLRWSDVDPEAKRIRLRHTKSRRDHWLYLSPEAWALFEHLAQYREAANPYVWPGRGSGPKSTFRQAWVKARKAAGLEDIHIHDLRRTAASWLAQAGTSTVAIQHTLNHSQLSATQIYARMGPENTREPLAILGTILRRVEGQEGPQEKEVQS